MTVYELIGTSAWTFWDSRGDDRRIGLFSTNDKAEDRIREIKKNKEWKMSWQSFRIVEVNVE